MKTTIAVAAIVMAISPLYTDAISCFKDCRLDQADLILTRYEEGCTHTAYKDVGGHGTIGCGHLIKPGESFRYLTPGQQEKLLEADMQPFIDAINDNMDRALKQNQVVAIADLLFNTGAGDKKFFFKRINDNQDPEFLQFSHIHISGQEMVNKGLLNRRQAESTLYNL